MNNYTNPITVTGNPASFEASGNGKLLSLSVPFSPIQDLHGYDSPWPAGGGKNKLKNNGTSGSNGGITWIVNEDGSISLSGTVGESYVHVYINTTASYQTLGTGDISLVCSAGASYNPDITGINFQNDIYVDGTYVGTIQKGDVTRSFSGTKIEVGTSRLRIAPGTVIPSGTVFYPAIEIGTTISSTWSPYSNICPITGRTGLSVYRTGKNLIDPQILISANGNTYVMTPNYNTTGKISVKPNTTYTISIGTPTTASVDARVYGFNAEGTRSTLATTFLQSATFTTGADTVSISFYCKVAVFERIVDSEPMLELGSTATTYEPYNGNTYAVDWTTSAGTVYGGTLDVVTGVLTVDRAIVTLDGSEAWTASGNAGFYTELDSLKKANNYSSVVCDKLQTYTTSYNVEYENSDYGITGYNDFRNLYPNQNWIYAKAAGITTAADFKTWLSSNPLTVVYELATPLTYQLTPTQVELLIGQNNVWSDSNEAVTLTYVIELFTRYTFIVNGNDYTGLVERDSYRTAVTPVYGETIQTLDGVGHTALLRVKGSLTVKLNPQTAAQTAAICADLLNAPCEVQYKCLQRNVNVTALMVLDVVSAMFLSRCLYLGQKWNDVDEIVLKEL